MDQCRTAAVTLSFGLMNALAAQGQLVVEHVNIRLDRYPVPLGEYQWGEAWGEIRQFFPRYFKPAATAHVFVRNGGGSEVDVTHLSFNGKPVEEVCTTPEVAGPVIWYRANPEVLQPGQFGLIYVRLRDRPDRPIDVGISTKDGQTVTARLTESDREQIRLGYVGFNQRIDRVYLYVERLATRKLNVDRVYLDGRDLTASSQVVNGSFEGGPALVETTLDEPLAYGSYHCLRVTTRQGPVAMHQVRARDDRFQRGIVAGQTPLKAYHAKFFNSLYHLHGSFPTDPDWWKPDSDLARLGFTRTTPCPSEEAIKAQADVPPGRILFNSVDEPDAHEPGPLPYMSRCGINIMRQVEPTMRLQRRLDPLHETMVLVDRTYAPFNWLVYGEVPDVLMNDIYAPTQWHGYDLDVFAPSVDALLAGAAPRPVHVMLWGGMNTGYPMRRSPTPEENDMSVHYVLGCGAKGVHYFLDWNSYPTVFEGGYYVGAPRTNMLWKNMGRMNAEMARLAPLLAIGHPFSIVAADSDQLWARSLLCGKDNFVVVLVNRKHRINVNDRYSKQPHIYPVESAAVALSLPGWFTLRSAVHVTYDDVRPIRLSGQGQRRRLEVRDLRTSMVLVLSQEDDIAERLTLDSEQFAALMASEKPRFVTDHPPIPDTEQPDAVIELDAGAGAAGSLTLDLRQAEALARATRLRTDGDLRLEPGQWLGLFTRPDWHGQAEIVFRLRGGVPLLQVTARLISQTPNFAACANNVVGISQDGRRYAEDSSFKMEWNGGAYGPERGAGLSASLEAREGEPVQEFYVRVLLRDPGIVASDEATNLAETLTISWEAGP